MRYFEHNSSLTVNEITVSFTDQGPDNAPTIIFIHGFPLNKTMWDKQVELLKTDFRVITYDIRGHGESDAGNDPFSIDLLVSDLIGFMNVLEIEKASICGLSLGGYIALNAIENYPERFEALVLCDTNCISDSQEVKEKRIATVESIIKDGVHKYAVASIPNLFAPESLKLKVTEVASVKNMILNTSELVLCSTLLALASRLETCSKLSEINVPVLILVGDKDILTPPAAAKGMHKKIKNSTLEVIEHAGHLSNLENPELFNHHLLKFFEITFKEYLLNRQNVDHSILKEIRNKLNMLLAFRSF
jgi:3-oxoadipate enol-lactonase